MNNEMQVIITYIIDSYGADVFFNMNRANAVLLDLAPGMQRERILVRSLAEADGFRLLLHAGDSYQLVINRLIQTLNETFSIEPDAAAWVTYTCAAALGYPVEYTIVNEKPIDKPRSKPSAKKAVKGAVSLVAIGSGHIVAAAADGSVYAHGLNDRFQIDVGSWNVVSVAAGVNHTVGLKRDGTVCATGLNSYDQTDTGSWDNISAIYAFGHETVGVRADGTAVLTGRSRLNLSHFTGIVKIAKAPIGIYGITGDGHVQHSDIPLNISEDSGFDKETLEELRWLNTLPAVADIIANASECVALCRDGCLYKYGEGSGYFSQWRDVVSVVDLSGCFAVVRRDGTVRILSFDRDTPREVNIAETWTNVADIYGNYGRLIGRTANGRLIGAYINSTQTRSFGSFGFLDGWYPIGV
jgi:hypothetical protein